MIESYWDLYVAYIDKCVRENWANDIDPAHYEMEWNHFLPQCIFGDQPVGQWLLLKQHSVASALQTLAFGRNCMCGHHKKFLPEKLIDLAWDYYRKEKREHMYKMLEEKDSQGKSLMSKKAHKVTYAEKTEDGKSAHAVIAAKASHSVKNEEGKSVRGVEAAKRNNSKRYKCLTTGFISNPGALSRYQAAKGLSTGPENRVEV
jgi:hypothetical protein